MLSRRIVFEADGVAIEDFACRQPGARGDTEATVRHACVFVRRGCFTRRVDGVDSLLDPTLAYCMNPDEEERFDHPRVHHGDDCTTIGLDPGLVASLCGGEEALPSGPFRVPPRLDLAHRLVLAAGRKDTDQDELVERTITLVGSALEQVDPTGVAAARPATARARRLLVDGARELLAAEPGCPLPRLARTLAVSPHHLSRIFRVGTGDTISRHRMRLRTRAALERIAGGEHDLARLAADVGFADQSHLCRVLRAETGQPPSALRQTLGHFEGGENVAAAS
jgi:AraC-like DNA-binding protein